MKCPGPVPGHFPLDDLVLIIVRPESRTRPPADQSRIYDLFIILYTSGWRRWHLQGSLLVCDTSIAMRLLMRRSPWDMVTFASNPIHMKKTYAPIVSTLLLPVALVAFMPTNGMAQEGECRTDLSCGTGTALAGAPIVGFSTEFVAAAGGINAGQYATFGVMQGQTYEWSMCSDDGATVPPGADTQLTLRNAEGELLCYSDDVCGAQDLQAKILWTATYTGEARVQVNEYNCTNNSLSHTMVWRCSTCGSIGMDELSASLEIAVWPNPAEDRLNLSFGNARAGSVQYTITDALGREVMQGSRVYAPESVLALDISSLASGQYMVRGILADMAGTRHFVKH
jgi:hypothetical protein